MHHRIYNRLLLGPVVLAMICFLSSGCAKKTDPGAIEIRALMGEGEFGRFVSDRLVHLLLVLSAVPAHETDSSAGATK